MRSRLQPYVPQVQPDVHYHDSLLLLTRYNQMSTPDGDVSVLGFRATRDLRQGETILCVT